VEKDEDHVKLLEMLWEDRHAEYHPFRQFLDWPEVQNLDEEFKHVVSRMTNLDPKLRITAHEALKLPWFSGIEGKPFG